MGGTPAAGGATPRAPGLGAVVDGFLAWYYRTQPVSATFIGVHDHDDRLPDWSPEGLQAARAGLDALAAQVARLPAEPLSEAEALDRAVLDACLDVLRWEFDAAHLYRNPSVYVGEAIFGVLGLFLRPFAPLPARVDAAIARMHAIPAFLAQARAALIQVPGAWTARAIRECRGALAFLERGVEILIRDEAVVAARALRAAAAVAAGAFRAFQRFLDAELLPQAPGGGYACGPEALDLLLRRGHMIAMTPAEVRALAEAHLARQERALAALARQLGAASWQEALAALGDRHPPADRYYARFAEIWHAAREAALAAGLVHWPDAPIWYVAQPRWARDAAPDLYFLPYRAPAPFDRLPVVDYLVSPVEAGMPPEEQRRRLRAANDTVITLNHVIHHGGLGHHVQNWYASHAAGSRLGQIAAVDGASRIALFCGGTMAEGWACYATDLMEEIGFLDPPARLALAHARLRLAARALADVQLHTGTWTLEQTAAFYQARAGLAPEVARAEAVKNSMFPATAAMYLLGVEQIHGLRRMLAARPGFDLRAFHTRLLSCGSVPVALAARTILREPADARRN